MTASDAGMTTDTISTFEGAVIQHGPFNDRVYLMNAGNSEPETMLETLRFLAKVRKSSKIIAKIPSPAIEAFCAAGYQVEARIPGMYQGKTEGLFLAKYPDPNRAEVHDSRDRDRIIKEALAGKQREIPDTLPEGFSLSLAEPEGADELARLYDQVFATYPFPIHRPDFLKRTMKEGTKYFLIHQNEKLVAASSTETDTVAKSVEMTDFATDPTFRGLGLSSFLLSAMERAMRQEGYVTAYTIARALVPPVNRLFAGAGYQFGGTLFNNTNIGGSFESMNVWYKSFRD